ncbi:MAG: DUF2062 domain-containing protein [Parvibaculum sp.]|jgi:uncharacterized protein (DUF2062 family)|uniref:DUF2062 domain-containing protein n=1 Tax=Parvibaculum sp. TaxID=2024848 RepID=UPI003C77701B
MYIWRRVWRLTGTPHMVALGVAAGVFMSFTPFLGFHIIVAMLIAWVFRGNLLAAAFGTMIGNPVTYPPIWLATYDLGNWMLGVSTRPDIDLTSTLMGAKAFDMILPVLLPMAAGSLPLGLAAALITYFIIKSTVAAYQLRRREQLEARIMSRKVPIKAEDGE